MMKAVKANKVYTVDETTKDTYLAQGFNIIDDKGKVIEHSPSSSVSYEAYSKVVAENKALKAEIKKLRVEDEKQVSVEDTSKKKGEAK